MTYEELLMEADSQGLIVREKEIPGYGGRIYKNRIAIHKGLKTTTEKSCVLAEELGHYHTTYGNIVSLTSISDQKQELKARMWAYNHKIGLLGIIKCYEHGCRNRHEMADFLDVTEDFLIKAIKRYRQKYGSYTTIDNYIIYFEPNLGIAKMN